MKKVDYLISMPICFIHLLNISFCCQINYVRNIADDSGKSYFELTIGLVWTDSHSYNKLTKIILKFTTAKSKSVL